jgi:hypothetical protein
MKRTLLTAAIGGAAAAMLAPSASAQLYFGAGYTVFQAETAAGDADLGAVIGRVGYKYNPLFGVEGEFSIGVQDESFNILGTNVDVGLDSEAGVFAVGYLPIPLVADVFGRIGYANLSVGASAGNLAASADGSGLAYGGGVQFNVLLAKVRLEYTRYEPDDGEIDSLGISGIIQF